MKKTMLAVALLAAALTGCANEEPKDTTIIRETNTTTEREVPAQPAQPAAPAEGNTTIINNNNEASPTPASETTAP